MEVLLDMTKRLGRPFCVACAFRSNLTGGSASGANLANVVNSYSSSVIMLGEDLDIELHSNLSNPELCESEHNLDWSGRYSLVVR